MLFNSFEFLLFLPIVFGLYWLVGKSHRWQNITVFIASYVFYAWWDWRFCFLLLFTSLMTYFIGLGIEQSEGKRKLQKWLSATNIIVNVGILGIFKYFNFFAESFAELFSAFGIHFDSFTLQLILPVGISFYTFQALGYSIDVYQHKIKATHDIFSFMAFISFFPQLLAGPIERASNMLPQYQKKRSFDYTLAVDGCRQILYGVFKKMVIADNLAAVVNTAWDSLNDLSGFALLVYAFAYSMQIYSDFSGYSDISIGIGKLFGIRIMQNFNYPYFSRNIPDFWRKWHISLMKWFQNYIYFPLGGSRCSKWKVIRNTFIVFAVSGLWHGANWTFVVWGLYHALIISVFIFFGLKSKYIDAESAKQLPSLKVFGQMVLTFVLATFGWIIFRADNFTFFAEYVSKLCSPSIFTISDFEGKSILAASFLLLVWEWLMRKRIHGLQLANHGLLKYKVCRIVLYYTILMLIFHEAGKNVQFIYSQF